VKTTLEGKSATRGKIRQKAGAVELSKAEPSFTAHANKHCTASKAFHNLRQIMVAMRLRALIFEMTNL